MTSQTLTEKADAFILQKAEDACIKKMIELKTNLTRTRATIEILEKDIAELEKSGIQTFIDNYHPGRY